MDLRAAKAESPPEACSNRRATSDNQVESSLTARVLTACKRGAIDENLRRNVALVVRPVVTHYFTERVVTCERQNYNETMNE